MGKKVPVPLLVQIPLPVVEVPANVTIALLAHTVWFEPAVTTGVTFMTTFTETGALVQVPLETVTE